MLIVGIRCLNISQSIYNKSVVDSNQGISVSDNSVIEESVNNNILKTDTCATSRQEYFDTHSQPILKTEMDSISYMYGIISYQALSEDLPKIGVVVDTSKLKSVYKQDEILKVNHNSKNFIAGLIKGLNSPDSMRVYNIGLSVGFKVSGEMNPDFLTKFFGVNSSAKLNNEAFLSAFTSAMRGESSRIDNAVEIYYKKADKNIAENKAKQEETRKIEYADGIAESKKFMIENKKKKGVISLPSGLQYKVITMGTGDKPTSTDVVKIQYQGKLIDDTVFDSGDHYGGKPTVCRINSLIQGLSEALQLMPVGSKWIVYIPYDLAYGDQDDRGLIKPFSNLIFELELISIEEIY